MKKKQAFSKLLSAAMLSAVATGCDDDIALRRLHGGYRHR